MCIAVAVVCLERIIRLILYTSVIVLQKQTQGAVPSRTTAYTTITVVAEMEPWNK